MKKFLTAIIMAVFLLLPSKTFAQSLEKVNVYLFYSTGCPHCAKEREFLDDLSTKKSNLSVYAFEVGGNVSNAILFGEVGKFLGVDIRGVPFTVIGSNYYSGFGSAETTGVEFIKAIRDVELGEDEDIMLELFAELTGKPFPEKEENGDVDGDADGDTNDDVENNNEMGPKEDPSKSEDGQDNPQNNPGNQESANEESNSPVENENKKEAQLRIPETLDLGIFGNVNTKAVSLPVLTFVIALVDGFNPCAMWVLLFLISLLLGFQDRKRMWILGLTFIAASALVYFLFMAAWLNFFLFVGFLSWVRIIVGAIALFFAYKNIRSFIENKDGGCEVTKDEKRIKTLQKIKTATQDKRLLPAMAGMVLLAFAVNLIEAICSAGLPAVYTQILTLSELPTWRYYLYIVFYQLVFMLDDMAIFIVAMVTMQAVGVESKYARWVKIFGGIIMLLIGLLLIFKPEYLLFG